MKISYVDHDEILVVNKTINKEIANYNDYINKNNLSQEPYWGNHKIFKNHFDIIQTWIDEDIVTITNPNVKEIYKSDFYFLISTTTSCSVGDNLCCCYYFKGSNQILLFKLGTGLDAMNTQNFVLINFKTEIIYSTNKKYNINNLKNLIDKIITKKNLINKIDDYESFLKTLIKINTTYYCGHNNVGHNIFNDYSGLYLLEQSNILKKTQIIRIGPHNSMCFKEYFLNKYPENKVLLYHDTNLFNNTHGRGIVYKYNHHFVSNNMRLYLYKNIKNNNLIPTNNYTIKLLDILDKNTYKLLIVLRCGSRNMINQENQIIKFIEKFKKDYPTSIIILGGFIVNNEKNVKVGYFNQSYQEIYNEYNKTANKIIDNCNYSDIYNINNCNFKESLMISYKCNMAIYQHGSGSTIAAWLCNIHGISLGFHDMKRYISIDKYINQDNKIVYLTDNKIIKYNVIKDHIYTFELNINLFYDYFNNNIIKKLII